MHRLANLFVLLAAALPGAALAGDAPSTPVAQTAREIAPVLVTGVVFGFMAAVSAMVFYASHRARRDRHALVRFAIEKGAAIPPELLRDGRPPRPPDRLQDLRRGLLLVGFGAGLALMLKMLPGAGEVGAWSIGAVPALVGAGYLVTHALGRREPGAAPADPAA